MFRLTNLTRAAGVLALATVASCEANQSLLQPSLNGGNEMFRSYVALGNSITAGYQSGGINDSTQRQSYARLLATSMGTQYHFASLAGVGCPPPISNGLTQLRVGGATSTSTTCQLRSATSVTDVLNNVAVPGATSYDPTAVLGTGASNTLTSLILGGKTQVSRALDARPTFATIWIGNNDVLSAGASGILVPTPSLGQLGILSTQAQFQANYDAMIKQLTDSAPGIKGVLIGVVQVGGIPLLSTGDTLFKANTVTSSRNAMAALAGLPAGTFVNVLANCSGSSALVNVPSLLGAIRAGTHPNVISCVKNVPAAPIGDVYVLDQAEQATLGGVITGYNNYIASKAAAIGFAFVDPNPILGAQRAANVIPRFPNFTSTTATFGTLISLDGVHPAAAAHVLVANAIIAAINTTYSTSLPNAQ